MSDAVDRLKAFVAYAKKLDGDEKGEAQVFVDRLFQAFGHEGYKEAGAVLEFRLKKRGGRGTSFADLLWRPHLLLEMKKRGEKLQLHFQQAFDYWITAVPERPRYVVLCNFDEFWVYDFDKQIDAPVDVVALNDLPKRYLALNFLFPDSPRPQFGNDREAVSREAANSVARVFHDLVERGESRERAQRFVLQTVVAMFAEDMDLLPRGLLETLIADCERGESSYDLLGALFRQMNSAEGARAGRFKGVPYFNGGLYAVVDPVDLKGDELGRLAEAARQDWSQVNPAIFGTLFQASMDAEERHALGAHFTSEADILRVVTPTIIRPWRERIEHASTMKDLLALRAEMLRYRVLDAACGSGNFLYVSFRSLVRLEIELLAKLKDTVSAREFAKQVGAISLVSPRQFFGIDRDSFGIELAKVTLMVAKKLAIDEAMESLERAQIDADLEQDHALPLDNLDANFVCGDALFLPWPKVDAIVSNPPFQSKNKMQQEFGRAYVNRLRAAYPDVPGRADYCVYWFRRAHDALKPGQRAGLVGTNTITQNYSREGGLDYIVKHGGTITEAVASQVWSGDAVVHVAIVNWVRGTEAGKKLLFRQVGDNLESPWQRKEVDVIDPALSFNAVSVTDVAVLQSCARAGGCYQGQTHGHKGFLMPRAEAEREIAACREYADVLFPFLTADDLVGTRDGLPTRYVIDFGDRDVLESRRYARLFERVKATVLADREARATEENERNREARQVDSTAKVAKHHANFLANWWRLSYHRAELMATIAQLPRYITCGRVTKRPIFAFVSSRIHPNDALMVFPYADDYSFGILQSGIHWAWFTHRCSTLKGDPRYTSDTVFDTFAWPQTPTESEAKHVARAAQELRALRAELQAKHNLSLRELYRTAEQPGRHPLRAAHAILDEAVRRAYGMPARRDPLAHLVALNADLAAAEARGEATVGPGLPPSARGRAAFLSTDCLAMPPRRG